jgi:hypothetical protein
LQGERLVQDAFALLPDGTNAQIWFLMALIFVLCFFVPGIATWLPKAIGW